MRTRLLICTTLLVATSLVAPETGWAAKPPTCNGKPATHVMKVGDPKYEGTPGVDVVVGSPGDDEVGLEVSGSADIICGNGGNDTLVVAGPGSFADGGPGDDSVSAGGGGLALGGSGNDTVSVGNPGSHGDGGSGSDFIDAKAGATGEGGSGNDELIGGFNHAIGATALFGGSGSDTIYNFTGNPKIDCGSAYDLVYANGATDVRRCEGTITPP